MEYPQIEGHPAQMTKEEAWGYSKPVMVGHNGSVRMCKLFQGDYYIYDYMGEYLEGNNGLAELFCSFHDAEAIRGCTGFDF